MGTVRILILSILLSGCGIGFQSLTLDDSAAAPITKSQAFNFFGARQVFLNSTTDVWGLEKDACKDFQEVRMDNAHQTVLHLNWNKTTCDWVGFGIGWSGWQAKDMSEVMEYGEFVFNIRAAEGISPIPTMIFLLEDYGTTMSAGVAGAGCIERYPIDTVWQECRLPLSAFDYKTCGIDLTNIKQLVIELQGSGNLLMDNIRIEPQVNRQIANKKVFPPSVVSTNATVDLMKSTDTKIWGLGSIKGRYFDKIGNDGVIRMQWEDCDDCYWYRWGLSWTNWKAANMSATADRAAVSFEIRNLSDAGVTKLPITLTLESYDYTNASIELDSKTLNGAMLESQWLRVSIPFEDFKGYKNLNVSKLKQLIVLTKGSGLVEMRNISIDINE
ncbi:MAG: hypothetical protein GC193_00725 [Cryomorphaceae bacterium]|nr:hypothetical protein [Cryomorphaceae bacterium]